jgi:hypothetical protein
VIAVVLVVMAGALWLLLGLFCVEELEALDDMDDFE